MAFEDLLRRALDVLRFPLFTLGETPFSLWTVVYLVLLLGLLFGISNRIKRLIAEGLLARRGIDRGVRHAVGSLARYAMLTVGLIVILQTVGVDLSTLTVFAGAVGIGIGFGLQNIAANFISGLILLFERPIKVGDRIVVGGVQGDVVNISARATTVVTNDNIAIIVPNSSFVSEPVTNWSYTTRDVRFRIPVGVAYGSDPERVRDVLLQVARAHSSVLAEPAPDVLLTEFGDSSLNFVLRVWTREQAARPGALRSELNYAISKAFKEHDIEIPFPQRDLHIRSGFIGTQTAHSPS